MVVGGADVKELLKDLKNLKNLEEPEKTGRLEKRKGLCTKKTNRTEQNRTKPNQTKLN